jgi:hypothetical protein
LQKYKDTQGFDKEFVKLLLRVKLLTLPFVRVKHSISPTTKVVCWTDFVSRRVTVMWSPQELIGQKVWLILEPEQSYGERELLPPGAEAPRIQAELLQPTSPPWFFARYLNPPITIKGQGQWLSLHEAQQAVLLNPVLDDYEEDDLDFLPDDFSNEEYDSALDIPKDHLPSEHSSNDVQNRLAEKRPKR